MIAPKTESVAPKSLTKVARATLYARQEDTCPWCGEWLSFESFAAHHRLLRSAGGTWDMSNIVALHPHCHNIAPGSVHQNPARAYSLGFMIRGRKLAPADVPIYDKTSRGWKSITDWTQMLPTTAAELLFAAGSLRSELGQVTR